MSDINQKTKEVLIDKAESLARELKEPAFYDGVSLAIRIDHVHDNADLRDSSIYTHAFSSTLYDVRLPNPNKNNGSYNIPSSLGSDLLAINIPKGSVLRFENLRIATSEDVDNLIEALTKLKEKL